MFISKLLQRIMVLTLPRESKMKIAEAYVYAEMDKQCTMEPPISVSDR